MRITTTKQKLLDAVSIAERIVGKKETLPVLSCILLEADKDITVRATNLEAAVAVTIPGDIGEKGVVAVPATVLSQTLRSILSDKVTCKLSDGNLLVESKGTKTLIKAIPHDEFPKIGDQKNSNTVQIPREHLLSGIQSVVYAASPSMIRPELGCIYIHIARNGITTVATDSFRLAEKQTISAMKLDEETDVLVPLKHAVELAHVLEHVPDEIVALAIDESQISVDAPGIRYTSRVIDGTFPNYKEIVPKSFSTEVTLLKSDMGEMLKKARVFSGTDQHVGIHVYPQKKIFSATARSNDVGEMSDSIDAAISGEDIDINFHIGYLSDCLSSIESDSITLSFGGVGRPLVIRGVSNQNFMYLVMPLNR